MARRVQIQQLIDLLECIREYPTFPYSRIAAIAGVNQSRAKIWQKGLIANDYIIRNGHGFTVTAKGGNLISTYTKLNETINQIVGT
jgi:predicted transcriptional regulator